MRKRINAKQGHPPNWLQLAENENLLFCGTSPAKVRNPLAANARHPECAILTDKRLIVLAPLGRFGFRPAVTTIPLSKIQSITSVGIHWNLARKIICGLLFIPYTTLLPGIIFLLHMKYNSGTRLIVGSGLRFVTIKFNPSSPELAEEFTKLLELFSSYK